MKNKIGLAEKALFFLASALAAQAVVCVLTNVLTDHLSFLAITAERLRQLSGLGALASAIASALVLSLARLVPHISLSISIPQKTVSRRKPTSPWWRVMNLALCGIILTQSIMQLHAPLDWDELDTATRLGTPSVCPINDSDPYRNRDLISPTKNTRNHTIANIAVVTAYRLFGVSEHIARLPSLLFTILLLMALLALTEGILPPVALTFLLVHLATNGLFVWYSHSLRGYISMELFTFLALMELLRSDNPRSSAWMYAGFILAASITHTFGALFCLLLFSAHLMWTAWQAPALKPAALNFHLRRIGVALLSAPIILYVLARQFLFLNQIGFLNSQAPAEKSEAVVTALGISSPAAGFWIVLVILLTLVAQWIRHRKINLLGCYLVFSAVVLGTLVHLLKATLFEPRFLLAFLIPTMLWVGVTISEVRLSLPRYALWALALAIFLILPLKSRTEIFEHRTSLMGGFGNFMTKVTAIVPRSDANCIAFSGEPDQVMFSLGLFYPRRETTDLCQSHYRVHFAKSWKGQSLAQGPVETWMPLLNDGDGRTLEQSTTTNSPVALKNP